ncbi:hypothetical protein FHS18_001424 [Paenibacillus phyllosphaerae]|uniref:Uncharacterized protein n=1 Tax=Paenibacillus phyllosphaerae TaxID=274593 RepID=A0A7W5AVE1_9BACL|nr:hypothetical protein [Paenibacillus phyllosphaerae]
MGRTERLAEEPHKDESDRLFKFVQIATKSLRQEVNGKSEDADTSNKRVW